MCAVALPNSGALEFAEDAEERSAGAAHPDAWTGQLWQDYCSETAGWGACEHAASAFVEQNLRAVRPFAPAGGCQPHHANPGLQHQVGAAGGLQAQRVGYWRCVARRTTMMQVGNGQPVLDAVLPGRHACCPRGNSNRPCLS
eukprot:scaffold24530_cov149-Isochrysis_galbana.AAC.1